MTAACSVQVIFHLRPNAPYHIMNHRLHSHKRGFTLIELLISITIIVVLAAIVVTVGKRIVQSANGARDLVTMRGLYNTIPLYAADHNDFLPGPLWTNIAAAYNPSSNGRLCNYIYPYLGYEDPVKGEFFPAMAYTWQKTDAQKSAPCAFMRKAVPLSPTDRTTIMPFGHPQSSGDNRKPRTMSSVFSQIDISRTWAMSDIDQLHPDIKGNPGWKKSIPEEMSHGTYRIAIYFDGHSGKLNQDNERR